ncbi:MAG: hydrolase, haloacid dehalogenase-like family [Myxococcaceae bacterium]|nr:hydrolase, haloacid dehalogenase-like family [Myxococcaceae bacterium]
MKRVVLLDVDGTLVDSNQLHAEAWQAALAQHGFKVDIAKLRSMIGMGGDKVLPAVTGLSDDNPVGKQVSETRSALFMRDFLPRVRALPGARQLVERILDRGHRPVVASSAHGRELEGLLTRGNLLDLLPLRTGADDAESSKPDPDIVQAALHKARVAPREAILVGDTPYDLKAAARAGVGFVGVRSGGYDDRALRGALAVYEDAAELCEAFDRSPLAS